MKKYLFFSLMVLLCGIVVISCQNPFLSRNDQNDFSLNPHKQNVVKARLYLYVKKFYEISTVTVHKITNEWVENKATWLSRTADDQWDVPGGDYDPDPVASFTVTAEGWVSCASPLLTSLVNEYMENPESNYGFLLKQTNSVAVYSSNENCDGISKRPYLEILYTDENGTNTLIIQREDDPATSIDVFIWGHPDSVNKNLNWSTLYTGMVKDAEKRTLIKFDTNLIPRQPQQLYQQLYQQKYQQKYQRSYRQLPQPRTI